MDSPNNETTTPGYIALRPHHIGSFAYYYSLRDEEITPGIWGRMRSNLYHTYGSKFTNSLAVLYNSIINREVQGVVIVKGPDSVCEICKNTAQNARPECEQPDNLQTLPLALTAMAVGRFELKAYPIEEFFERIEMIVAQEKEEDILGLIKQAHERYG